MHGKLVIGVRAFLPKLPKVKAGQWRWCDNRKRFETAEGVESMVVCSLVA